MKRVTLVILVAMLSVVSTSAFADLASFKAAAHNFSRIQSLINQHRSIVAKPGDNSMTGGIPIPSEVTDEASKLADNAESWGCDLKVTELPPQNIQMGQQTTQVVPFKITYEGQACPLHLVATMNVTSINNQPNTFKITADLNLKVDQSKVDQFGFQTATAREEATLKFVPDMAHLSLSIAVKVALESDGGPNGHVKGEQGLSFNFSMIPSMQGVSEDYGKFLLAGKSTTLKRKITLSGFTATSEFFVDDAKSNQKTYEDAMQGLQFFGINEQAATPSNLSCLNSIFEAAAVSVAEQIEFKKSGKLPQAAPAFSWKVCGKSSTASFGKYQITNHFDQNWLLTTLAGAASPVNIYVLYDEESHFISPLDNFSVFLSCKAANKCERSK